MKTELKWSFTVLSSQSWTFKFFCVRCWSLKMNYLYLWMSAAQVPRKLTFLYLANDVIQNSKRKGPEFTQDFAPVIVDAFKHVYRSVSAWCILASTSLASVGNDELMIAFICVSSSEMARRIVENSWAGFYPSGRRELCMTAPCWISCRRSSVSSRSVHVLVVAPFSVENDLKMIVETAREGQNLKCVRCIFQWGSWCLLPIDGEKKAKKRQYEEIQPDVEDFASQSSPAEPPQVLRRKFPFCAEANSLYRTCVKALAHILWLESTCNQI